jgi:dephospho-CoA kinase
LPPSVLANEEDEEDEDEDEDSKQPYIVHPKDSVYPQILEVFEGQDFLTPEGRIDRLKLGSIIFKDAQQRRRLNRITHPKILLVLIQQLFRGVFFGTCDITVADVPLLFESGKLSWLFAVTICVTVGDPSVQLHRLQKRNPELSKQECQARIDSQLSLETKQKLADIVIDNTGSLEQLSEQVEQVRKDLMGRLYGIGMSLLQMLLLIGGSTSIAVSSKFYTHWQQ